MRCAHGGQSARALGVAFWAGGRRSDEAVRGYDRSGSEARRRGPGERPLHPFTTWKWLELQGQTAKVPVYRYQFEETLPRAAEASALHASGDRIGVSGAAGARSSLAAEDRKLSELMGKYWTNFAKTATRTVPVLPRWPVYWVGNQVMRLSGDSQAAPDAQRIRYLFLDRLASRR